MRDRRDDRVRELERRRRLQPTRADLAENVVRLAQGRLDRDALAQRAMSGDEVVGTDELVELDQVHVPGLGGLRRVQDHE